MKPFHGYLRGSAPAPRHLLKKVDENFKFRSTLKYNGLISVLRKLDSSIFFPKTIAPFG